LSRKKDRLLKRIGFFTFKSKDEWYLGDIKDVYRLMIKVNL